MKALGYLKDIKNYLDPELWVVLDEAIEELEVLKHNYEMQQILIDDYKKELEVLKHKINISIEEIEWAKAKPMCADVYLGNAIRYLKECKE